MSDALEAHLRLSMILESLKASWELTEFEARKESVGWKETAMTEAARLSGNANAQHRIMDEHKRRQEEREAMVKSLTERIGWAKKGILAVAREEKSTPETFERFGPPEVIEMAATTKRLKVI